MKSDYKISSQMLKGILEGCILVIIKRDFVYGYEMNEKLQQFGFSAVSEGTIYPLLLKLQNKKLIIGESKPSPDGPKRKYYKLTELGEIECYIFIQQWQILDNCVNNLLKGDENSEK
ncbi:PadR family transcriptional regulator [Metaclostridioides mangenotii]|uniref:PadR family transcriptional regulator n=1 Tax=Metaclostridioides mangenotii TaxID=1540 RepID=UPI000A7D31B5|nr:PadR family transcriptional regulator [Clostridioides mangenotii]